MYVLYEHSSQEMHITVFGLTLKSPYYTTFNEDSVVPKMWL